MRQEFSNCKSKIAAEDQKTLIEQSIVMIKLIILILQYFSAHIEHLSFNAAQTQL